MSGSWPGCRFAPPAGAAGPADRATPALPEPTASVANITTADCDTVAAPWAGWAREVGIDSTRVLSVLRDGVVWVWPAATEQFLAGQQMLDMFDATQHLTTTAAGYFGEGPT